MLCGMLLSALVALASLGAPSEDIVLRQVIAVERLGERRRSPVYTDGLEALLLVEEDFHPREGDTVRAASGDERTWASFEAGEDGWFRGAPFRGGWIFATIDVPAGGAWRLDAAGHSRVLVDGAPHFGDHYDLGTTRLPLALEAGEHRFLFRGGRGKLRAKLEPAPAPVYIEPKDLTQPDVLADEQELLWSGVIISNATPETVRGWRVVSRGEDGREYTSSLPPIHSSSFRKCPIGLHAPEAMGEGAEDYGYGLRLLDPEGTTVHTHELRLRVSLSSDKHVRTFVSEIDGSVQYFGVTPPRERTESPALVLSLHGAGVEARNQAGCYRQRDWGYLVAPTNRRSFGFDWEDWGRLDALEVLEQAERRFGTDERRTYLTGHSMGGHGTWQLGAHFPDRFAAIAPSAGWRDFWSYGGAGSFPDTDPVGVHLNRAMNASRTLLLEKNYLQSGIYLLHGDNDQTVRVKEARAMRENLAGFHPNFAYYEKSGAGHWWGNQCMDWPPLFEFLKQNSLPDPSRVSDVEFSTINPAISSRCQWFVVESQERSMEPSHIRASLDAKERTVDIELENVQRFQLDLSLLSRDAEGVEPFLSVGEPLTLRIGEEELRVDHDQAEEPIIVERVGSTWSVSSLVPEGVKTPERSGPFKLALRHRMVFVYGTGGSAAENRWAFDKARYDHETWRYRGNGSVDVVADRDFDAGAYVDRGVVLYGNRDTNQAFGQVLDTEAFELAQGYVRVGDDALEGDQFGMLAIYPRKDSERASVAVVGGTGLVGSRITTYLPYFFSGVGYPDWIVFGPEFLERGLEGVRASGYFDPSWNPGESVWRQARVKSPR